MSTPNQRFLKAINIMRSFRVQGRNNQIYIIDLDSVQWLEFMDDKYEILINKGEKDEAKLLVNKEKYPHIKIGLLKTLVAFI